MSKWASFAPQNVKDGFEAPASDGSSVVDLGGALEMAEYVLGLPYFYFSEGGGSVNEAESETKVEMHFTIPHTDEFVTGQLAEIDQLKAKHMEIIEILNKRRGEIEKRRL